MTTTGQVLRIEEINFIRCLILFSDKSVAEFYILFDFEDFVFTHLPLVTFVFLVSSTDSNNFKKIPVLVIFCPSVSFEEIKRFKCTHKEVIVEVIEVLN